MNRPLRAADPSIPDGTVVIDGMCVLCAGSFAFVARRDPDRVFQFAALQSEYGRWLAPLLGIDPDEPDTFAVILDGQVLLRSDGALAILRRLPGWSWVGVVRVVPRPVRDWIYDRVARNRYRVFGRRDTCLVPGLELRSHMAPTRTAPPP
jgi:predicted DCC family thiol-disulfide oxidoreductase YuxK